MAKVHEGDDPKVLVGLIIILWREVMCHAEEDKPSIHIHSIGENVQPVADADLLTAIGTHKQFSALPGIRCIVYD